MSDESLSELRVDKWLWAARFFKTRSISADACEAGHVKREGVSLKPSKVIRAGDRLEVTLPGPRHRILEVVALSARRGPAPLARALYIDHTPVEDPVNARGAIPARDRGAGRPTKRDRRMLTRIGLDVE